ncbi:cadherin-like beta sandwich domain-containing protein, partial [Acutalibacter caecimuris]|uniref:cadherin-like beta sandwich domain-containing protein n=1 Tax=Acutalibacter caecimuris TaxID=3093657 RepID=UPI002AC90E6F
MNKSKFLKKSLAAFLAILMVAAMIPMSAFAADDPDILYVGGKEAVCDGESYAVTLTSTSGKIGDAVKKVELKLSSMNGTKIAVYGANGMIGGSLQGVPGTANTVKNVNLVTDAKTKPETGSFGTYTLELQVTEKDAEAKTYPLSITFEERSTNGDTTLAKVTSNSATGIVDYKIDNEAHKVTIVKPIGKGNTSTDLGTLTFEATDKDNGAKAVATVDTNVVTGVTVTAENGSTQKYTVEYAVETIFESFGIPGATKVEATEAADGTVTVTVTVPFGTDVSEAIATYTVAPQVSEIAIKGQATQVAYKKNLVTGEVSMNSSGVAAYDLSGANGVVFTVKTEKNDSGADLTLKVKQDANPDAVLTGVKFGDQVMAAVSSSTVEVMIAAATVPATADQDIILEVSKNAHVTLENAPAGYANQISDGSDADTNAVAGQVTFEDLNLSLYTSSNPLKVIVQNEGKTSYNRYNMFFTASGDATKPVVDSIKLIDGDGNEYVADSKNEIEVPFGSTTGSMANWTVVVNAKNGATVESIVDAVDGTTDATPPGTVTDTAVAHDAGTKVNNGITKFSELKFVNVHAYTLKTPADSSAGTKAVYTKKGDNYLGGFTFHAFYAANGDGEGAAQKCTIREVAIKTAPAKDGHTLTALKVTTKNDIAEVNESNTFDAVIDQDAGTIRVDVPYGYTPGALYVLSMTKSEGSKVYDEGGSNEVTALVATTLGAQNGINPVATMTPASVYTYEAAGAADFDPKNPNTGSIKATVKAEDATHKTDYYIYAVRAQASAACDLNGISSTTKGVSARLDESIANSNRYIITVPYSFNTKTQEKTTPTFNLTFDISEGAVLKGDNNAKAWTGAAAEKNVFAVIGGKLYSGTGTADKLSAVANANMTVTAENEESTKNYTYKIKIADVDTDATVTGITAAGTAAELGTEEGKENQWNLTLPYGTALEQKLEIEASNLATLYVDGAKFDAAKAYDLSKEVAIRAVAEDGVTEMNYTLVTTVAGPSTEAAITALKVGQVEATINGTDITANIGVDGDLTKQVLTIETSAGATVTVNGEAYEGAEISVEEPVAIEVTAEDGETKNTYTLTVTATAPSTEAEITGLTVNGKAVEAGEDGTYAAEVEELDVEAIEVAVEVSEGATYEITNEVAEDK